MIDRIKIVNRTDKLIIKYKKISDKLLNCYEKHNVIKNYKDLFYKLLKLRNIKIAHLKDNNDLFAIINKKCKRLFIKTYKLLLTIIINMIKIKQKTFIKLKIDRLKQLLKKPIKTIIVIKAIFIETVKIMKIIRNHRIFGVNGVYFEINKIYNKKYNDTKISSVNTKCRYANCLTEKIIEKKRPYIKMWIKLVEEKMPKKLKIKKLKALVKTKEFSDYLECMYKHCLPSYINVFRKEVDSNILLHKIKDINYYNKHLKNKYEKLLKDIKSISDENYVKVIGNLVVLQFQNS